MEMVKEKRVLLLIGSSTCAAFSQPQSIRFSKMSKEEVKRVVEYGTRHLNFCVDLCATGTGSAFAA